MFELVAQDRESKARRGRIATVHGVLDTPAFMPIGTQGAVKGVSPQELRELQAQIILGNTYHLFVRPGLDVIKHFGGLHKFMNWDGPILTDSGGYQIFSLAKRRNGDSPTRRIADSPIRCFSVSSKAQPSRVCVNRARRQSSILISMATRL